MSPGLPITMTADTTPKVKKLKKAETADGDKKKTKKAKVCPLKHPSGKGSLAIASSTGGSRNCGVDRRLHEAGSEAGLVIGRQYFGCSS